SDDEKELGPDPVIASLSLGATRTFQIRLKDDHSKKISVSLLHGSLLVMSGRTQSLSQHRVPKINPKNAATTPSRINLTFRTIR
ncbi:MAG: alpha-ketoglutarate-dependent dioxygenase AlkB, partial [Holophagaceae bacterium]